MTISRKRVVLPDFLPNQGIKTAYRAELNRLLRSVRNEVMAEVKRYWETPQPVAMDNATDILARMIDHLMGRWATKLNDLPQKIARKFVGQTKASYDRQLSVALKKEGFSVNLQMTETTAAAVRASVGMNVGLIKSIPGEYLGDVQKYVWEAVEGGFDLATLTDKLDHAYHIGRNRAKLIARDQSIKAHAAMEQARRKELGVKQAIWRHSAAAKEPRHSHVKANGKTFDIDKGMYLDGKWVLPGQEINCHPGFERLSFGDGFNKLWRRRYAGELALVVTEDGTVLHATPNHPVLTNNGWVAVNQVREGDYLIHHEGHRINAVEDEVKAGDSTFSEVFDAASFFVTGSREASAAFQFHGDTTNQEVDAIDTDRFLPRELDASAVEEFYQFLLAEADHMLVGIFSPSLGSKLKLLGALLNAPEGIIRRSHLILALLKGELSHLDGSVFTDRALLDEIVLKARSNCSPATVKALGELQLANPGLVESDDFLCGQVLSILANWGRDSVSALPDFARERLVVDSDNLTCFLEGEALHQYKAKRVVNISFIDYDGHVYNLSNDRNWYLVQGLVSHNCGCTSKAIIEW